MSYDYQGYVVVDANGKRWAAYGYEEMAYSVADRLNEGGDKHITPELAHVHGYAHPFRVEGGAA